MKEKFKWMLILMCCTLINVAFYLWGHNPELRKWNAFVAVFSAFAFMFRAPEL